MKIIKLLLDPKVRFDVFLSPYRILVTLPDGDSAEIGRGSIQTLRKLRITRGRKSDKVSISIGNFVEMADCTVMIGGDHEHTRIYNGSLGGMQLLRQHNSPDMPEWRASSKVKTNIGSGVIVSYGAIILQGAQIGDGAVIGAGSIVTKTAIDPFVVAVGNPARPLRSRFETDVVDFLKDTRWWDYKYDYLQRNIAGLMVAPEVFFRSMQKPIYAPDDQPKILLSMADEGTGISFGGLYLYGFEKNGGTTFIKDWKPELRRYFEQVNSPKDQELLWCSDIFEELLI